jgi:hypothetical protein
MTVRLSPDLNLTVGEDFVRTDRGITWGIKVTDFGDILKVVSVCVREPGGTWTLTGRYAPGLMMLDDGFDMHIPQHESVIHWVRERIVPRLNLWLAAVFPPTDGHAPPPPQTPASRACASSAR